MNLFYIFGVSMETRVWGETTWQPARLAGLPHASLASYRAEIAHRAISDSCLHCLLFIIICLPIGGAGIVSILVCLSVHLR